jgi:hypothetical protein
MCWVLLIEQEFGLKVRKNIKILIKFTTFLFALVFRININLSKTKFLEKGFA